MLSKQSIPNILTWMRIVLIAPICVLMVSNESSHVALALGLYVVASLTDFLDGYLARRWDVKSDMGRFLDPIADKLLITAVIIMLVADASIVGLLLVCPILILLREIFIAGLREFMGPRNIVVHVTKIAKWKTTMQLIACGLLIGAPVFGGLIYLIGQIALIIATLLTVMSGYDYWRSMAPHMKEGS